MKNQRQDSRFFYVTQGFYAVCSGEPPDGAPRPGRLAKMPVKINRFKNRRRKTAQSITAARFITATSGSGLSA